MMSYIEYHSFFASPTMGIPGLWKILEPTAKPTSLIELSIREGFMNNRHRTQTIVVGVDASLMIYTAQSAIEGHSHGQTEQNLELCALFLRLAWLSRSGVSAVFVFDGPDRPKYRRNRRVRATPYRMTERFQDFIMAFGFYWYTAPGDAEAELGYLNACQAVDVVLTSNNNIFLFGAKQVIRSPANTQHLDSVSVFTEDIFQNQHSKLFTVAGFFLMAVLSGGDYDTVGLPNCGPVIASALAAGPLSQSLYEATTSLSDDQLRDFLPSWRNSLRYELANDPYGRFGKKYICLAENIPPSFPDPNILKQYCFPLTSIGVPDYAVAWLRPQVPHTAELAKLCSSLFDWGPDIIDRFISNVWDGHFIRKLIKDSSIGISIPRGPPNLSFPTIDGIQKIGNRLTSPSAFHFYQVTFWIPSLTAEAATAVLGTDGPPNTVVHGLTNAHSMSVWVPAPLFQATNWDQIVTFHCDHSRAKSPKPSTEYYPVLEEFDVLDLA